MLTSNSKTVVLEKAIGKSGVNVEYSHFQNLQLKQDDTSLWYARYASPAHVPETMKQRFTNVNQLLKFIDLYYSKRNIRIKEVINDGI